MGRWFYCVIHLFADTIGHFPSRGIFGRYLHSSFILQHIIFLISCKFFAKSSTTKIDFSNFDLEEHRGNDIKLEQQQKKLTMYNREYTPEKITALNPNEIFVFGSNLAGSHGGGAARLAHNRFGAIWGKGVGLQGQCYAIPTMQGGVKTIKPYVDEFIDFAIQHAELTFLVTKIGCGIAAFRIEEIAPLFKNALEVRNIILPQEFVDYLNFRNKQIYMEVKDSSWDAEKDFLKKYRVLMEKVKGDDHDAYYKVKELRAKEFRNTIEIVNQGSYVTEKGTEYVFQDDSEMICNTVFYEQEIRLSSRTLGNDPTIIEVQNIDCLYAGIRLKEQGYNPAILNMASRRNPGGGVTNGAGAQEETLFRRTNLFRSLYQFAPYAEQYGMKRSHHQYPLDRNFGGIYTPDAIYFRESEQQGYALLDNPVKLSFITVPGMNRPDLTANGMIADYHVEPIKNKIRTIFRIGLTHGHDSLVLGALGCGAFRNPPRHVAQLFHEVLREREFRDQFRRIVFAILDDHNAHQRHNPEGNFNPFANEFKPMKENYMNCISSQILWAMFHKGYNDPEDYINDVVDYENAHDRNPVKTDFWEKVAREWIVSDYYETDKALFKQIYDRVIDLFEANIIESFDVELPEWNMGYDDVTIELNFNEDMVDSEHIQIWIEGIPETIIEKLEMTLEEINRHVSY